MKIPFLYEIILYCLYKLNEERSVSSIYHLLNGKISSQTLQDMHLFGLTSFFKTNEHFTRSALLKCVEDLNELGLIQKASEQHYRLTEKGLRRVNNLFDRFSFLHLLNGWVYQNGGVFWERLSLLVQVTANLSRHVSSYVPVQKNKEVQEWLKAFLKRSTFSRVQLGEGLYRELERSLADNRFIDPLVVVLRLTGAKSIGLTEAQAAKALRMDETLYQYQFLASLHYLMRTGNEQPQEFPILYELLRKLQEPFPLTFSTKATKELLDKGLEIEEIATTRGLKVNTIQDHIVELALNLRSFDISPYVAEDKEKAILLAAKKASSKQLKYIRSQVETADYFEIRLVMAKYGDEI